MLFCIDKLLNQMPHRTAHERRDDRGREPKPLERRKKVAPVFDNSDVSSGQPYDSDVAEKPSTTYSLGGSDSERSEPKFGMRTFKASPSHRSENGATRKADLSDSDIDEISSDNSDKISSSEEKANHALVAAVYKVVDIQLQRRLFSR